MLTIRGNSWGNILRTVRVSRALKLRDLSVLAGVNIHTISRIERDEITPSEVTKTKIARALDMKVSELFPHDVPPGGDAA